MHLENESFASFLKLLAGGDLSLELRHLLECPGCRARLLDLLDEPVFSTTSQLSDRVFDRALHGQIVAAEQAATAAAEARPLLASVLGLPEGQRSAALLSQPTFHQSEGLPGLLLEEADMTSPTDPRLSGHLAGLAMTLLEARLGRTETLRQEARALVLIATSLHRQGLFDQADDVFRSAIGTLDAEPIDIAARAWLCYALALLRMDQGRIDEALALLARATQLFEELRDHGSQARSLIAEGQLRFRELDHEGARRCFRAAAHLVDEGEPLLHLELLEAWALCAMELVDEEELQAVLDQLQALSPSLAFPDQLRVPSALARVEWSLGINPHSLYQLEEVFTHYVEGGAAIEASLVALELTAMYLEQRSSREDEDTWDEQTPQRKARDLARSMAALRKRLAQVEGRLAPPLAAVLSFTLHYGEQCLSGYSEVLQEAARYLRFARYNPELPFFPVREIQETVPWCSLRSLPQESWELLCRRAGVEPAPEDLLLASERQRLAWTYEALYETRILLTR